MGTHVATDRPARTASREQPELIQLMLLQDDDGVRRVLAAGADPNVRWDSDAPAICLAARLPSDAPLKLLIAHGAVVNVPSGTLAPTVTAITGGRPEKLRILLDAKADPNAVYDGRPLLCWAAQNCEPAMIELLLARGARLDAATEDGKQALHLAVLQPNAGATIAALLRAGADPNFPSQYDGTPLELAALRGRVQAVKALLEAGARVPPQLLDSDLWERNVREQTSTGKRDAILAVQRIINATVLAQTLGSAMGGDSAHTAGRANDPSPL